MRLSFPNGEHADVVADSGVVGIGGAEGNTVQLDRPGIKPRHARVVIDQRGMILEVLDAQARIHVNARPVLEKALLRLGDVVNIDDVAMLLMPDRDDSIDTKVPVDDGRVSGVRPSAASVVLRGVSGAHFGKTIAIGERLVIGQGGHGLELDEPGMSPRHASIDAAGDV
ncbi:MAG: FHA domain-containing protein, partial [Dokdonella sp.]